MKLSKIYCNKPEIMSPIHFKDGLNVVLAQVHRPTELEKDTHNLGKTTLCKLIDFCFLSKKQKEFFLFKQPAFSDFIFYLEIELPDGSYVTVRRGVADPNKIAFKKHPARNQDFTELETWDHDVSFEKAKTILEGLLDWEGLNFWSYRNELNYLLRTQDDYKDVFHLKKFGPKHVQWKPFLAYLLGLDGQLLCDLYAKKEALNNKRELEQTVKAEVPREIADLGSNLEGLSLLKSSEAERKQAILDDFDFREQDKAKTLQLVNDYDAKIASLNEERYAITKAIKRLETNLQSNEVSFDISEVQQIFQEAKVAFNERLTKDFETLVSFNKEISQERNQYLNEELQESRQELSRLNEEIDQLGRLRASSLSFLKSTDVFDKYKQLSKEITELRTAIETYKAQQNQLDRLQNIRKEIQELADECQSLQLKIAANLLKESKDKTSRLSKIRIYLNEFVEFVIGEKALLSVQQNKEGYLDFDVDIVDQNDQLTSASEGHSYGRLLCIAFDLAVLRAHQDVKFPRFVYHDGLFESWDNRKKEKLHDMIKQYADCGLQLIVTAIDADLPADQKTSFFKSEEIILTLHDRDMTGQLFKMPKW